MLRRQNGDTIVEVLIAIAVVGSVLSITYSIMNRNLLVLRDNQERTEAVKQAQSQIEALKALWGNDTGRLQIDNMGEDGFCISEGNVVPLADGAPHANPADDGDYAGYHPEAAVGSSCQFAELYHLGIVRESLASGNTRFKVYARWDKLGGGSANAGKNEAIIVYRLD